MIERVISGGQTGADQGGLMAAKWCGLATGGWMPRGWLTEQGPRPDFRDTYGMKECQVPGYPARTRLNAQWADVTLWFGQGDSRGYYCTLRAAQSNSKLFWYVGRPGAHLTEQTLAGRLRDLGRRLVINVAGNRESIAPGPGDWSTKNGFGAWTRDYLCDVFELLGYQLVPF